MYSTCIPKEVMYSTCIPKEELILCMNDQSMLPTVMYEDIDYLSKRGNGVGKRNADQIEKVTKA